MKKRLGDKADNMYIGTLHGYANLMCFKSGRNTNSFLKEENFDMLIHTALKLDKRYYEPIEYLFVDEFQDTDELQYRFICELQAQNRFYVGDERQFIYSFRGASDEYIRALAAGDEFKTYYLNENYRNPDNILQFANGFLNSMPKISPESYAVKQKDGYLDPHCPFDDAVEEMTWTGDWTGWAVLCRTNAEVEEATSKIKQRGLPTLVVRRKDMDEKQLNNLGGTNAVKIMTIHTSKGLEFAHVAVIGAKVFNEEERRIAYVAATRATESLYWCPAFPKKKRTYTKRPRGFVY